MTANDYSHTFDCMPAPDPRKPSLCYYSGNIEYKGGPLDSRPRPHVEMDCPCGMRIMMKRPVFHGSDIVTCHGCKSWHSVLWNGPKSEKEWLEDKLIEKELARPEGRRALDAILKFLGR